MELVVFVWIALVGGVMDVFVPCSRSGEEAEQHAERRMIREKYKTVSCMVESSSLMALFFVTKSLNNRQDLSKFNHFGSKIGTHRMEAL